MKGNEFVAKYLPAAKEAAGSTGILPEVIVGAALLESGAGESLLAKKYNNFFGVKPGKSWKGKTIDMRTKEFTGTPNEQTITAKFRAYNSPVDSFRDYVSLLTTAKRYKDVAKETTIEGQAREIHEAGYSTAANYSEKLAALATQVRKLAPFVKKAVPVGALLVLGAGAIYFTTRKK